MTSRRSLGLVLAVLALAACARPTTSPPRPQADAAAASRTFEPATAPLPDLAPDLSTLDQPTHAERREALVTILRARGLPFERRPFENPHRDRDPRAQGENVVVTIGSGARTIVVGAHYDAIRLPDGFLSDGMVDNGAGTIVLTRVAEELRRHRLGHRVLVVFFDLEEIGLIGSRQLVTTLDRSSVAAMVNVDVAAYGNSVMFGPASHPGNAEVYAALHRVCAHWTFTCLEFPAYPPSDDRSFQAAGIPNISMGVLPRVEAHQMWLVLNGGAESGLERGFAPAIFRTIHTPSDVLAKVQPAAMTLAYNAIVGLILELDRTLP